MKFKDFIKKNERDFSDYLELKKQIDNLENEISKIKASTLQGMQLKKEEIEEYYKNIERIDQEIDEIEKEIIEVKSSLQRGGIFYKLLKKDEYNNILDELDKLDAERERLIKEKNRIIKICNAIEEVEKSKELITKLESQIEEKKKKLIELIDDQISYNLNNEVKTGSDKQKTRSILQKEIDDLRKKICQIEELLKASDSKLQVKMQSQLNNKIREKDKYEKRFEEDLNLYKVQKILYINLKDNIDNIEIIKRLLEKVLLDKTEANKDDEITIFDREYSVDTNTGLVEIQDKNHREEDIKLNEEDEGWYYEYVKTRMKEEDSTIITDPDLLKFNEAGRYNKGNDDEREAI